MQLGLTVVGGKSAEYLFNPGVKIPAEATAVHGITDEMVARAPRFSERAGKLVEWLKGKDLLGYNLRQFDLPLIDAELRRCGFKLDLTDVRVIDAYVIFAKKHPRDLSAAVKEYCLREHEGAHGAGADAAATADVFTGQLAVHEDLRAMSLDELADFCCEGKRYADLAAKLWIDDEGDLRFDFGKHKDQKVIDHLDFVDWMRRQSFPGSTMDAINAYLAKLRKYGEARV